MTVANDCRLSAMLLLSRRGGPIGLGKASMHEEATLAPTEATPEPTRHETVDTENVSTSSPVGVSPVQRPDVHETLPSTQQCEMADDVMLGQTLTPSDWDAERFRHVALIQEASRNQGRVELAEDKLTGRLVAMKVMPLSWICERHEDFVAVHPGENECPWRD